MCAVDAAGKVVFSRKVANSQAAIEQLITRTTAKATGGVVDMTSGAASLLITLAETARMRGDLTPITSPDAVVADLGVLTARREDLMAGRVRGVNRVRELLASIFPALERALDHSTRSALILLTGFQTPDGIRAADAAGLSAYLTERGAWVIARLTRQLLELDRESKDLDKQLGARFAEHPDAGPITSLAGSGPILGAQLPAGTGGDLHRPKRYHRGLRRVFHLAALTAIRRPDSPSRVFHLRKRSEGKGHTQALARRPVEVIWALLRDRREFHPLPPITTAAAA
ncbi:transposase [Amycolatopsis sp. H6(2020)]|nr:transposase [Amycolatopsis sp. H6(2020)]